MLSFLRRLRGWHLPVVNLRRRLCFPLLSFSNGRGLLLGEMNAPRSLPARANRARNQRENA